MKTQIFISYRRSSGLYLAKSITDRLQKEGYQVFFDYSSMRNGEFNRQIYDAIEEADDIVFIWSENALDNSSKNEDWVRIELLYAQKLNKNIIILRDKYIEYDEYQIPKDLSFLRQCNFVDISLDNFDDAIRDLKIRLKALPEPKIKSLFRYSKWFLLIILLAMAGFLYYLYTPLSLKDIKYENRLLMVPETYFDLDDVDLDEDYLPLGADDADLVYGENKNFNEFFSYLEDDGYDDMEVDDFFEDLSSEEKLAVINKLKDKSLVEKEGTITFEDYAQLVSAMMLASPMVGDQNSYMKNIAGEKVFFVEFTQEDSDLKKFWYKMAAFSKNGDAETVYMLMMGCSEYVSHFKRIKNFNTLNMIVKKFIQHKDVDGM